MASETGPSGSAAGGVILSDRPGVVTEPSKPALQLSDAQQQAVVAAVVERKSHQPTPKEFKPEVGANVPRLLDIHGMPERVATDIPALRQYMYAHGDRTIAIIDPLEKKVVAVIPLPEQLVQDKAKPDEKAEPAGTIGGLKDLKPEQRQALYRAATAAPQPVPSEALLAGAEIPAGLALQPLPADSLAQAPAEMRQWHYARLQDGRLLLVDPASRKVQGIITQDEGTKTAADESSGATTGQGGAGGNTGIGSAQPTADPLREREESGKDSAYTGPSTTK